MAKKKVFMSVTASAVIASTLLGAQSADAASYTVKRGDSLWSISQKHNTSVAQLKTWNNLSSDIIFPNQVIKVSNNNTNTSPPKKNNTSSNSGSSASTYTVIRGDTLSKIASTHGISLKNLMDWNNLKTTLIFPGDKLIVSKGATSTKPVTPPPSNSTKPSGSSTYTVKSGDTLSKIAANHGISLKNLMEWNNLTSHLIYPGNKLIVSQNGAPAKKEPSTPNTNPTQDSGSLISVAKSVLGAKYTWAGTTPSGGFDCSGFIYWAMNKSGTNIARLSTEGYYNRSYIVNNPQVGDLVFFENTYKSGISHMGIYLGNNEFIHAGTSTGVAIANLNNPYWKKHFHSFKKFY